MRRTAGKAASVADCLELEQLPNVGPAMAADLRSIGIDTPAALRNADALVLYRRLCTVSGQRQDPCVLDTFMAVIDFANGGAALPWWKFTQRRKSMYGTV